MHATYTYMPRLYMVRPADRLGGPVGWRPAAPAAVGDQLK